MDNNLLVSIMILIAIITIIVTFTLTVSKSLFYYIVLNNDVTFQQNMHTYKINSNIIDVYDEIGTSIIFYEKKSNIVRGLYNKKIVSFFVLLLFIINKKNSNIL
jgi:hypothetical protein